MKRISAALACALFVVASAVPAHASASLRHAAEWRVANVKSGPATVLAQTVSTTAQPSATATGPASQPTTATATVETRSWFGTLGSDLMTWAITLIITLVGGFVATYLLRGLDAMGIKITDERKLQIKEAVLAGLNWGAAELLKRLPRGAAPVPSEEAKALVMANMIRYVEAQKPELIRIMGETPGSKTLHQALTAHAETLINNPKAPTPPIITPPEGKAGAGGPVPVAVK